MSGGGPRLAFKQVNGGVCVYGGSDAFSSCFRRSNFYIPPSARRFSGPSTRHGYRGVSPKSLPTVGPKIKRLRSEYGPQGNMHRRRRGRVRHPWIRNQYIRSQKKPKEFEYLWKRFTQKRLFMNMASYCNARQYVFPTPSQTINIAREIFATFYYSKIPTRDPVIRNKSRFTKNPPFKQT